LCEPDVPVRTPHVRVGAAITHEREGGQGLITERELDKGFGLEVAKRPGGADIRRCFSCGTCAASCPVGRFDSRFNPRRVIRMTLLGCHTCSERCPQGVHIPDIMTALKNMAREAGYTHPTLAKQIDLLRNFGRVFEVEEYDNKRRAKMGLPELEPRCEEVKIILDKLGVNS
jgi:heterodisulfide reductase subunit C